jgi:hypothetical protein
MLLSLASALNTRHYRTFTYPYAKKTTPCPWRELNMGTMAGKVQGTDKIEFWPLEV